jgi:hypothetical protein
MKRYELPNSQIVEVCTLKETRDYIECHNDCLKNGFEPCWVCVLYKDGKFYDNEMIAKVSNIRSADLTNEETIAVYGNFKLCDIDTCEEYTVEEAMKREGGDYMYIVVLY